MRNFAIFALALLLPGCGKFLDKFSRLEEGYTRVELVGDRSPGAALEGGVMIIFARSGPADGGSAFGFTSAELAMGRTVVVPNGSYKVLAFAAQGAGILEGQAKCGAGNGGAPVNLSGGSTTINFNISAANCGFGTTNQFFDAEYSNTTSTNLDNLLFQFCSTQGQPCDTNTSATWRVRFRLLGGHSPGQNAFFPSEPDSLTSPCSSAPSSGVITSSVLAFAGSEEISPPAEILVYNDSTCSGAIVGRIALNDGLRHFRNAASGSAISFYAVPSSNSTYVKFKFP